jgi:serine/threonine protein kinase
MPKQLTIIAGPDLGRTFPLHESASLLLGRSRHTDTPLSDLRVSRVHCEVELKGPRVLVTDLDSAGGTFINNQRISEQHIAPGDILMIGDTQLRLDGDDVAEQPTLAPEAHQLAAKPAPRTADRLHELSGSKLSHFEIGGVIAKGQSGLVFRANDFKGDQEVALKVLWPEFSKNEEEMQRFIRAMKTMLPHRHPNLVTIYGAGKSRSYCWIAMEYVEGESLTQIIDRIGVAGMLDWRNALRVAVHLARALEYAHGHHIIHRNLTPQNILVRTNDRVTKLGDLMLAKAQEGSLAQQITKPGELLGDVRYMSPEQTRGGNVDNRSDLYSLGALVYALLTGRPPFQGQTLVETITAIRQAEPVKPKKFHLAIPDQLEKVVMKLLAKRPEDRYQNAAAVLVDLERVVKFEKGIPPDMQGPDAPVPAIPIRVPNQPAPKPTPRAERPAATPVQPARSPIRKAREAPLAQPTPVMTEPSKVNPPPSPIPWPLVISVIVVGLLAVAALAFWLGRTL